MPRPPDKPTLLTTKRLTLRRPRLTDADWVAAEIAKPEVLQWLTTPPHPYKRDDAVAWLTEQKTKGEAYVIVTAGGPVGVVSHRHGPQGELGYWLSTAAWGHGYMTEAATAVIDAHFRNSRIPVPSGYIRGNTASCNVLTKLGFQNTTVVKKPSVFHGGKVDIQKMVLTEAVWAAQSATVP